jgi:hypothetical protein
VTTTPSWGILRQVVIATDDLEADATAVRRSFGLGEGIVDPTLAELHLEDALLPVSDTRYLELVSPTAENARVTRWLAQAGGRTGMVLCVQHPDVPAVLARCRERGVRIALEAEVLGHPAAQLHPADVGVLLEVDGIADPTAWYWDDLGATPEPDAGIDEVLGVVVPVADPGATTALWSELLGLTPSAEHELELGGAWLRFVGLDPTTEWTVVLRRTRSDVTAPELPGVRFELV